jgi:hypothetical protein
MRRNLGEFSWPGFIIAIVCCVALGLLIYKQFSFTQVPKPQDAEDARISNVEQKVDAMQSKIAVLEQQIKTMQAVTTAPKPVVAQHGRNH